jgi:hypothetical protein
MRLKSSIAFLKSFFDVVMAMRLLRTSSTASWSVTASASLSTARAR